MEKSGSGGALGRGGKQAKSYIARVARNVRQAEAGRLLYKREAQDVGILPNRRIGVAGGSASRPLRLTDSRERAARRVAG